jgi:hypothetical protein
MSDSPPILTPERIDAMLAAVAEVCMEGVAEAQVWLKAAEDVEAFERASRALQTHCRNLRQTIAMKQRFDREQAALKAGASRAAEAERKEIAKARKSAVSGLYWRARTHLGEMVWNEYEENHAEEIFTDLDQCLSELSTEDPDAFLATPFEDLIDRFSEEFGLGEFNPDPKPPPEPEPPPRPRQKGYDPPPPGSRFAATHKPPGGASAGPAWRSSG